LHERDCAPVGMRNITVSAHDHKADDLRRGLLIVHHQKLSFDAVAPQLSETFAKGYFQTALIDDKDHVLSAGGGKTSVLLQVEHFKTAVGAQ
jgi:hypothetical protein